MVDPLSSPAQDPLLAAYFAQRADLVRHFALRLRSPERAEDLVQELYLRIAQRAGTEPVENPSAYLYRVGSNLMLDLLRHEQRQSRKAAAFATAEQTSGGRDEQPDQMRILAARQQLERIAEAVSRLPAPVQRAFRLHKLEGLSHAETAAAMGVSRSSVEKYLMTCLRTFADRGLIWRGD